MNVPIDYCPKLIVCNSTKYVTIMTYYCVMVEHLTVISNCAPFECCLS